MKKFKQLIKYPLIVVGVIVLAFALYVGYLFLTYNRYEDNIVLTPDNKVEAGVSADTEYTIITQNIGFGAYVQDYTFFMDGGKESRARSKESITDVFRQAKETVAPYNPDFLIFQEVDTDSTRSLHVDESEILRADYPDYDYVYGENFHSGYLPYPLLQPHGASKSGLCTFANAHIDSALRRSFPITKSVSKIVDLDRCYTVCRIPVENGKELLIYNLHMTAYGAGDDIKQQQVEMLMADMSDEYARGNYCIAGGDFNADLTGDSVPTLNNGNTVDFGWCMPFPAHLIPDGIHLCTDYSCGEQRATCRNNDKPYEPGDFTIIVDGFCVSDNVETTYLENIQTDFMYSDHNPVVMRFILH